MQWPWSHKKEIISLEMAEAIAKVIRQDKAQKAFRAGKDVSNFKYDGMSLRDISEHLERMGM